MRGDPRCQEEDGSQTARAPVCTVNSPLLVSTVGWTEFSRLVTGYILPCIVNITFLIYAWKPEKSLQSVYQKREVVPFIAIIVWF